MVLCAYFYFSQVNYGDFCTVEKEGFLDVDVGYGTEGAEANLMCDDGPPSSRADTQGEMECLVCMDAQKVMMFSRCRHLSVCEACGNLLKKDGAYACPLCRVTSPQLIRVHY